MKDGQILSFCRKNRIRLPLNWRHSCNAIRFHDSRETDIHFNTKAKIAREIFKKGGTVFTELELQDGVCDIFWLDEKMVIELENTYTEERIRLKESQYSRFNVFVFSLKNMKTKEILERIGLN